MFVAPVPVVLLIFVFEFRKLVVFAMVLFGVDTIRLIFLAVPGMVVVALFVVIGAGGLLILMMRKWAAAFAVILLIADIGGRVALVLTGLYPLGSFQQIFAIVAGTVIAIVFGIYIAANWKHFK